MFTRYSIWIALTVLLIPLFGLILAGCDDDVPSAAINSSLFPLAEGQSWTYEVDGLEEASVKVQREPMETWTIDPAITIDGDTAYPLRMHANYSPYDYILYLNWDEEGLRQYGEAEEDFYYEEPYYYYQERYAPPITMLKRSIETGMKWDADFTAFDMDDNDELGSGTFEFEVLDTNATVTVPAGTFYHVVVVNQTREGGQGAVKFMGKAPEYSMTIRYYLANGIGAVKMEEYYGLSTTPEVVRNLLTYGQQVD